MIKQIQQFLIKVLFLIQYGIPLIPGLPAQLHGNLYEINHNLLESLLQQISGASPSFLFQAQGFGNSTVPQLPSC